MTDRTFDRVPDERLDLRPFIGFLAAVTGALLTVNVIAKLVYDPLERNFWTGNFDVNREANAPTLWNASLLLAIALTCVALGALGPRTGRLRWVVAALAASAMAADELLGWHEKLRTVGVVMSDATGLDLPTYAWLMPGALLALGLVVAVVLWVRGLPGRARVGVIVGAALYVAGALGVEAISGWVAREDGIALAYNLVTAGEEGLEMTGCLVVLAVLLGMLRLTLDGGGRRAVVLSHDVAGASVPPHRGTDAPEAAEPGELSAEPVAPGGARTRRG
ncbi:hypothetical protein GXB85_04010 [Cellulomonas sp. APG4]|uniref:hypothetical protein n=1 Tax=Cellulomonas sp. APG4 TaxID=1538656 RepID=UPI00137B3CFA|nr:hypothetical protein [Cellulomonas sp. APG4]NCT90120.1 hypothetical protein [Cellulomonas sp. APG4]